MFKIFKKKEEVPTPADAIQNLRGTEDMLLKKQDFLEKKIESEVEIARKNAKTNKRAALVALKRKKRFEKQLQQIDGTLTTIGIPTKNIFFFKYFDLIDGVVFTTVKIRNSTRGNKGFSSIFATFLKIFQNEL